MSTVSASVTRIPSRNSAVLPRRLIRLLICGPPPWTTTGRIPTSRISTMSWAKSVKASWSDVPASALPPYLTTIVLPANRRMYGNASTRTWAIVRSSVPSSEGFVPSEGFTRDTPARDPRLARNPRVEGGSYREADGRQAGGLLQPERDVGRLERSARRPLGQVVDRAEGDDVAGALVVARGHVGAVRAERRLRRRRAGSHDHEGLVAVDLV